MRAKDKGWHALISAAAESDIQEILSWTKRRFGEAQERAYAAAIAEAIAALAAGSAARGVRERADIDRGLYVLPLSRVRRRARHFIVFRFRNEERRVVDVFRVLHDAMDLVRHVSPSRSNEEGLI